MPYQINGQPAQLENEPRNMGGPIFVPLREVTEALGGQASWDGGSSTAGATINGHHVRVPVGSTEYTVDGQSATTSVATFMDNEQVWVPIELFQALGAPAVYDGNTQTVSING